MGKKWALLVVQFCLMLGALASPAWAEGPAADRHPVPAPGSLEELPERPELPPPPPQPKPLYRNYRVNPMIPVGAIVTVIGIVPLTLGSLLINSNPSHDSEGMFGDLGLVLGSVLVSIGIMHVACGGTLLIVGAVKQKTAPPLRPDLRLSFPLPQDADMAASGLALTARF